MARPRPLTDAIAAIATATGRGGIGVVRVSGFDLSGLVQSLTHVLPRPRVATLADFLGEAGEVIDTGLVLYFPAPHSYTGEDVVELQGHGGSVVLQMVLARCLALGARMAEPGEFTKRAFLNGRLDLAQAEGVADLIDASTTAAAKSAVRSLSGRFSEEIHVWCGKLVDLRMLVEATLDFPEEDIDFLEAAHARDKLIALQGGLTEILRRARQGSLLRRGLHVVLAGQPNVGKSSLLNQLSGEDRAIVTEVAGTTRDVLRESIQIEGIPLHIIDTAGLRETEDVVEKIGIARTWKEIERADVVIRMVDAGSGISEADHAIDARLPDGVPVLWLFNKIDLIGGEPRREQLESGIGLWVCARSGLGMDLLRSSLLEIAGWEAHDEDIYLARERHLDALRNAAVHVDEALKVFNEAELLAEELRLAQETVNTITGEFGADDLLGVIFSRFCIGK
jgi:tRNA modification GTPase